MPQAAIAAMATMTRNRWDRAKETRRLIMTALPLVALRELQEDAALGDDGVARLEPAQHFERVAVLRAGRDAPLGELVPADAQVHEGEVVRVVEDGRRRDRQCVLLHARVNDEIDELILLQQAVRIARHDAHGSGPRG